MYNHNRNENLPDEAFTYLKTALSACGDGVQNILLWSGDERRSFLADSHITKEQFERAVSGMNRDDLFMTLNTYVPATRQVKGSNKRVPENKALEQRLFSVNVLGIDIDYKSKFEKAGETVSCKDPRQFYDYLMETVGDKIPEPTIIEFGHQLRLVFVLANPIYMKTKNHGASMKLYRGLQAVAKQICRVINDELDCGAEPQKSWYRVPGSYNTKNGERNLVSIEILDTYRYTVQELMDEFLPDLPYKREEYDAFKKKQKAHKGTGHRSVYRLGKDRCEDYEILAGEKMIHREQLVFLYGVAYLQCHKNCTRQELDEVLLSFNSRLANPLPVREIKSKFRTLFDNAKKYRFCNGTIMGMLGIDFDRCCELGLHLGYSKKKKPDASMASISAKREEKASAAISEYVTGKDVSRIARKLGVSISSVRGYVRPLREKMDAAAKEDLVRLQKAFREGLKAAARERLSFRKRIAREIEGEEPLADETVYAETLVNKKSVCLPPVPNCPLRGSPPGRVCPA